MTTTSGPKFRSFLVISVVILFVLLLLQGMTLYYFSYVTTGAENNDLHETYMEQLSNNVDAKIKEAEYVVQLLGDYVRTSSDFTELYDAGPDTVERSNQLRNISDRLAQLTEFASENMELLLLGSDYIFGTVTDFPKALSSSGTVDRLSLFSDASQTTSGIALVSRTEPKRELLDFIVGSVSPDKTATLRIAQLQTRLDNGIVVTATMRGPGGRSFLLTVLVPYDQLLRVGKADENARRLAVVSADRRVAFDPNAMTDEVNRPKLLAQLTDLPAGRLGFDSAGVSYRAYFVRNRYSELTLLSFVPQSEFRQDARRVGLRLAGTLAVSFAAIGTAITLFWSYTIHAPIRKLLWAIRRNSESVLRPRYRPGPLSGFNLSLKLKFILTYGVLFLVVSYALVYLCYDQTRQVIERNRYSLYDMIATNAAANMDKLFVSYKNLSRLIALEQAVQVAAVSPSAVPTETASRITDRLLSNPFNMSGLNNVSIFAQDGTLRYSLIRDFRQTDGRRLAEIVPDYDKVNMYGYLYWSEAFRDSMNNNKFSIVRELRDLSLAGNYGKIGYLNVEINELVFDSLFNHLKSFNFEALLADGDANIISAGDKNYIGQPVSIYSERVDRNDFVIEMPLTTNGWRMSFFVPRKDIANHIKSNLIFNLYIALAFMLLIGVFLSIFYRRLIFPLLRLNRIIRGGLPGEQQSTPYVRQTGGYDEVNELGENFNLLMNRINTLIRENYIIRLQESQLETHKKEIELHALQSQINPHFIYNTLDSINWMIMLGRPKEAVNMVNNFSQLLRLSVNKGRNVVPIREEIRHVLAYMDIQLQRYSDRLHFIVDVDAELFRYETIKLILQPLIENAVHHGTESKDGPLTIVLRGRIEPGERAVFAVIDDGGGIPRSALDRLNRFEAAPGQERGIGLRNVHERIKLYCGEDFSVNLYSIHGGGTMALLSLPLMKGDD